MGGTTDVYIWLNIKAFQGHIERLRSDAEGLQVCVVNL